MPKFGDRAQLHGQAEERQEARRSDVMRFAAVGFHADRFDLPAFADQIDDLADLGGRPCRPPPARASC
jgi:hypothetical protein